MTLASGKKFSIFLTFILCITVFLLPAGIIKNVRADLIYNGVNVNYYHNPDNNVPTIDIYIKNIYDTNTDTYLNASHPVLINDSFIIYSAADNRPLFHDHMDRNGTEYYKTIALSFIPNGTYYIGFDFNNGQENITGSVFKESTLFTVDHALTIDYTVSPSADGNYVSIETTTVKSTYINDPPVDNTTVKYARYHIMRDGVEVKVGDLSYDPSTGHFKAEDVSLIGLRSGNFTVWLDFYYLPLGKECNSLYRLLPTHSFYRNAFMEDFMLIAVIILALVGIIVLVAFLIIRRSSAAIVRQKKTEKEEGPIEVIDIRKGITKIDVKKKKKVKGRTEVSQDLIFSVPKWEEEDLEAQQQGAASAQVTSYSLHCPACHSWYEIDEFAPVKCPKCGQMLSLAMYCPKEDKWFDVPEPGDYTCPSCGEKLRYSKE